MKPHDPNPDAVPIHTMVTIGEGKQVNIGTSLTPKESRVIHDLLTKY